MKNQFYFLYYLDYILVVSRCIQIFFFNIYFHDQIILQIFVAKGDTRQFFWEIIAYEHYNF